MRHQKSAVLRLFVASLTVISPFAVSMKTHSTVSTDDVSDLSKGLTSFLGLTAKATERTPQTKSTEEEKYKHVSFVSSNREDEKYEEVGSLSHSQQFKERQDRDASLDYDETTWTSNDDSTMYPGILFTSSVPPLSFSVNPTTGEQKKLSQMFSTDRTEENNKMKNTGSDMKVDEKQKETTVLDYLIKKNSPRVHYDDVIDYYTDDEDSDYFINTNEQQLKWNDYGDDGPSIMELIALSVKHKERKQRANKTENLC